MSIRMWILCALLNISPFALGLVTGMYLEKGEIGWLAACIGMLLAATVTSINLGLAKVQGRNEEREELIEAKRKGERNALVTKAATLR